MAPTYGDGPFVVEVNTRNRPLTPPLCCCCARPNPEREYTAEHARGMEYRARDRDTRACYFGLCDRCDEWLAARARVPLTPWRHPEAAIVGGLMIGGSFPLNILGASVVGGALGLGLGVAVGVGVMGAGVFIIYSAARSYRVAVEARRRAIDHAERLRPSPECDPRPVRYLGWYGTIRTFEFTHPTYFAAFCKANASKLID